MSGVDGGGRKTYKVRLARPSALVLAGRFDVDTRTVRAEGSAWGL